MHLIDALSWAHANCLLLPVFDTKFCAVILGLALGRITQHPCKCNLEIREERVANAEWTVIPGQCRKGTCGQMLLPFFPWVMALRHTSTWFLSCSPQIKQPDGHSSGQVRDASSYQLSLFPCFDAFAPHVYSLGSHLQTYYLHTSLYLRLHYLGNSGWQYPTWQPGRITCSSLKLPYCLMAPCFAPVIPSSWNASLLLDVLLDEFPLIL